MKKQVFIICCLIVFSAGSPLLADTPSIKDKVAGMAKFEGFFPFYWDSGAGKIWLEIDKPDREFLYVSSLAAGVGSNALGLDRNRLGQTRLVKFVRIGPKVLLIQSNPDFRAESDNPAERKAVEDAFGRSVVWGFSVGAQEGNKVLVDATDFLLRDANGVSESLSRRSQGSFRSDPSRSAVYPEGMKNFPLNTEFESLITVTGQGTGRMLREVVPDPSAVTIRQHHSFIQLPDEGFKPREFDPRSNFSAMSYRDYAVPVDQPLVKRFIQRHRLEKKDPSAEVSDPVEPIIYYVDPGVPEPIRSALVEGAAWWDQAFAAAGYRNAFQVKVLPDGAHPLDVRYNMINWVHRSTRGWSYGASVTDPRTGEIIKGHVALGSLRIRQDYLIAEGLKAAYEEGTDNSQEMLEMALARIRQLSCHEVGHTLGMGHNYASSVNDRASVMDYPHPLIKIAEDGTLDLSDAYDAGVGEFDKVCVAFGYQDFPPGVDEKKEARAILDKALSGGMYFLASQDAGPGSASPLAASWDNGADAVAELERVMKVRTIALKTFTEKRIRPGTPLALLEEALLPAYLFHRYQMEAAASFVGGLNYGHKLRGGVQADPTIVPGAEQRRALKALLKTIDARTLALDEKILNLIPPRPPGYRGGELFPRSTGDTFDPQGAVRSAADLTVSLLLHPERAARLVDYHSRSTDNPGLGEVVDALLKASWKTTHSDGVLAETQRTINMVVLARLMGLSVEESTSPQVRALAALKLEELKGRLRDRISKTADESQTAHLFYAANLIDLFQKDPSSVKLPPFPQIPQGAPIGN